VVTIKSLFCGVQQEVVRLGGRVVLSAVPGTTHLVAKSLLRTVKFLTALAIVQHVLTSDWIKQSSIANQFLGNRLLLLLLNWFVV